MWTLAYILCALPGSTVELPSQPDIDHDYVVVDCRGGAGSWPIQVNSPSSATVAGMTTLILTANYISVRLRYDPVRRDYALVEPQPAP